MDAADALMARDYVGHFPGLPPVQGLEAWKPLASGAYLSAFPDLHSTLEDVIAEGDKVVGRFTSRATHKGPLMGVPATGRPVTFGSIVIQRFADGKILEEWHQDDMMGILQQIGAIPPIA
jgi:predicted ester cyclase